MPAPERRLALERTVERRGEHVLDSGGQRVGKIDAVYYDPGDEAPGYVCLRAGLFGRRPVLVPLAGASAKDVPLRLAYTRQQIKGAPAFEPGSALEDEQVRQIFDHYELEGPGPGDRAARLIRYEPAEPAPATELGRDPPFKSRAGTGDDPDPPGTTGEEDLLARLDSLERRLRALQKALD